MVYNEDAYREVYPEVKIEKIAPAPATSMMPDDEDPAAAAQAPTQDDLTVDAPDPVPDQEGGSNDTGNSDTTD